MFLNTLEGWASRRAARSPWTNVYGLGRSTIALGSLLTLLLSHTSALFTPSALRPSAVECTAASAASLFCLLPPEYLEVARWVAVAVLLLVVSGWRPRWTGVAHWYVSWSFMVSATIADGGDQVAAILSLLMIPITLTDSRKSHWHVSRTEEPLGETGTPALLPARASTEPQRWLGALVAWSCWVVIRIQVAAIYFHASIGKLNVEEWTSGTALYYWFTHSYFGAPGWLSPLVWVVLDNFFLLTMVTWSVLVLEALLFAGLLADRKYWGVLLGLGVAMHVGIGMIHGIVSFALIMLGALLLFLHPLDEPLRLARLFAWRPGRARRAETDRDISAIGARPAVRGEGVLQP